MSVLGCGDAFFPLMISRSLILSLSPALILSFILLCTNHSTTKVITETYSILLNFMHILNLFDSNDMLYIHFQSNQKNRELHINFPKIL